MRFLRLIALLSLTLALLSACSGPAATPTAPAGSPAESAASPIAQSTGYPAPAEGAYPYPAPNSNPAYPIPEDPTPDVSYDPIVVPQPSSSEVGNVTGTLYRHDSSGQKTPLIASTVYLAKVIKGNDGSEAMVELNAEIAPKAQTNGLGQFVFTDVEPGRYGLMLQTLRGSVLLNNPSDGSRMVLEISGGKIVDLGEMSYELPEV